MITDGKSLLMIRLTSDNVVQSLNSNPWDRIGDYNLVERSPWIWYCLCQMRGESIWSDFLRSDFAFFWLKIFGAWWRMWSSYSELCCHGYSILLLPIDRDHFYPVPSVYDRSWQPSGITPTHTKAWRMSHCKRIPTGLEGSNMTWLSFIVITVQIYICGYVVHSAVHNASRFCSRAAVMAMMITTTGSWLTCSNRKKKIIIINKLSNCLQTKLCKWSLCTYVLQYQGWELRQGDRWNLSPLPCFWGGTTWFWSSQLHMLFVMVRSLAFLLYFITMISNAP